MHSRALPLVALFTLLAPGNALAQWQARVVARAPGASAFSSAPVQARVGEAVSFTVVLRDPSGRFYANESAVSWLGRRVSVAGPLPAGASVRWVRVESLLEHRDLAPPEPSQRNYSNAVLFGPHHGQWRGYDRLEYQSRPLDVANTTLTVRDASMLGSRAIATPGAGTLWFSATVQLADGTRVEAPGATQTDRLGLVPAVQRVSFRASDDFLGWLGTYFGVPYVFGSNGPTQDEHQVTRYTGADCADVLVGARRAAGERAMEYTSVAGIGRYARQVSGVLVLGADGVVRDVAGAPVTLRWGTDVQPGDMATIDFTDDPSHALPRAWDHIGALLEDRGAPGVLDAEDLLRHASLSGLADEPLRAQGAIRLMLWRWRTRGR